MKGVFIIILISVFFSCKSKAVPQSSQKAVRQDTLVVHRSEKLEHTTVYIHKKAQLRLKTDRYGTLYPEIEKGDSLVVKLVYFKKGPEDTRDGNYKEVLLFEIPDSEMDLHLIDAGMQKLKTVFARFCFCKDGNRYIPVTRGRMHVSRKKDLLHIKVEFKLKKSKQVLNQIDETISLKPKNR